ncbi:uroporphyrinogen decarboxylase family protein [Methanolobus sp. ZRKC3]|uniref:uroporphyrinogen decarboxylase family protein n=1 Tax=Methanolobus sp. ZRKC3 TaxID=3125786 RepID=UPI0032538ACE
MTEQMTSKERFINALGMKEVDRVPYGYLWFGAGNAILKKMNTTMGDAYYSAEGIAKAQILAQETYHHDNVMSPWGCILVEAEALGTKIHIKENDYPTVEEFAIKSVNEHDKIDPEMILTSPRVKTIAESIRIMNEKIGDTVFVAATIQSPMLLASQLMEVSDLCVEVMTEPDGMRALLEKLTKAVIMYADLLIDSGAHGIFVENGANAGDLFGPEISEEFIFGSTKQVVDHIKTRGLYVVSQNYAEYPFLDMEFKLKPDGLSFAHGDLAEMQKENVCLMGNMDQNVFIKGSRDEIEQEVKKCMDAAPEKGFILSTGGEISLGTPEENMEYLWDAIKSYTGK